METVASLWACNPGDLGGRRHEPWTTCEVPLTWTEPLSHHLHRNKQLQDTLLQREEELQQLQDENHKLRCFLNSAFVKNLEHKVHKVQRVSADQRNLKRNLKDLRTCRPLQVSKRLCRNLTSRFNSSCSESPASSEPDLDRWVLRTLGLKDRDTIDTSGPTSSDLSFQAFVYDTTTPSSSQGRPQSPTFSSAHFSTYNPPLSFTHSTVLGSTLSRSPNVTSDSIGPLNTNCQAASGTCMVPPAGQTAVELKGPRGDDGTPPFLHLDATISRAAPAGYWSPLWDDLGPPAETLPVPPQWSSASIPDQSWTPAVRCVSSISPTATSTPQGQTDVAFRMSLSPSSSVKTHSFPQGQAFTRKDLDGCWNFTWVPRQSP